MMTEETYRKGPFTTDVQRLDYSKPPPEYTASEDPKEPMCILSDGLYFNSNRGWWRSDGQPLRWHTIASTWAYYKAHSDPPGMTVAWEPADDCCGAVGAGDWEVTLGSPDGTTMVAWWRTAESKDAGAESGALRAAARAAAWAWYDRRLTLLAKLELAEVVTRQYIADDLWPAIVSWSDAQVALAERWLVDSTMELPEVLGGSAPGEDDADVCDDSGHVCTGCIGDGPCAALEVEIEAEERDADDLAEIEAAIDDEDEFMDDGLCSPMPQSEQPSDADGPLSRSRWAMSLSWHDLLRQHRDVAVEAEIRRRLACDEVPTELETRLAQWRADNPPPTPEQMASTKAAIRDLARRRKARILERGQGESGDPIGRDWNRQAEEHNATTLPLLNFSEPPPGYEVDCYPHEKASDPPTSFGVALTGARPLCLFADEGEAVAAAWSDYKLSHDPPGMWCGFSRSPDDLDNCSIRVGVHACGARWELLPGITMPYEGFTVKARAWAWAWHDRRHALMAKIGKMIADFTGRGPFHEAFAQVLVDRAPFHRVLCWHNEWVDEVEAWIEKPSSNPWHPSTVPEALR